MKIFNRVGFYIAIIFLVFIGLISIEAEPLLYHKIGFVISAVYAIVCLFVVDLRVRKKQKPNYETTTYEILRDWETPITKYHKGHINTSDTWAKIMGITNTEFHEFLAHGLFKNWFKKSL